MAMEQDRLQDTILSSSIEMVDGTSPPTNADNWWDHPLTTSQQFVDVPSSYHFTESVIQNPTTTYSSLSYQWPEARYAPYSVASSVAVSSQSYPPPQQQVTLSYPGSTLSPTQAFTMALSPQAFSTSPPPYPYSNFLNSVPAPVQTSFYQSNDRALLDDSPVSSPESLDFFSSDNKNGTAVPIVDQLCLPPPPLTSNVPELPKFSITNGFTTVPCPATSQCRQMDSGTTRKPVRMPQRKGGIQLWQFLYGLLSDKSRSNLIEWTSNRASKEFRMLEPESIAVWWGTIKSKPTMTYDKFSRSLRYYYHKGILKKIQGERYMYQFLVDPEDMYRHIGTSDKRPELKTMPKEAKMVMGIFQKQSVETTVTRAPIVTKAPEGLRKPLNLKTEFKLESIGLDFNNSNNTLITNSNDIKLPFSLSPQLPILIPAAAW